MNLNLDKINFSALAMMLLVGLFLALSSCEQTEPQGFADIPRCQDLATVQAWVFLTYVAEVHPDRPGLPSGYTAAIKIPFQITQVVPIKFKESDESILETSQPLAGRLLDRASQVLRRLRVSSARPHRNEPQDTPKKKPSKQLSEYMKGRKIVLPDEMDDKEYWMAQFSEQ
jgi:hypothetical protein